MANASSSSFAQPLVTLFNAGSAAGLTDRELLGRFLADRDGSAEFAFAVLVERHGAMVLRVCRSILGDRDEADDAFQATFLVLARKARRVKVADSLSPWLFGVARKVSAQALESAQRRQRSLKRLADWLRASRGRGVPVEADSPILEFLERLPQRFQDPVRLCDLDGFSLEEAAEVLGLPIGTLKSRLFRGRRKLRDALRDRGLVPRAGRPFPGRLSSVVVSPPLARLAVHAALVEAGCHAGGGKAVSNTVLVLTKRTIEAMFMTKIKVAVAVLSVFAVGTAGSGLAARTASLMPLATTQDAGKASATTPEPVKNLDAVDWKARVNQLLAKVREAQAAFDQANAKLLKISERPIDDPEVQKAWNEHRERLITLKRLRKERGEAEARLPGTPSDSKPTELPKAPTENASTIDRGPLWRTNTAIELKKIEVEARKAALKDAYQNFSDERANRASEMAYTRKENPDSGKLQMTQQQIDRADQRSQTNLDLAGKELELATEQLEVSLNALGELEARAEELSPPRVDRNAKNVETSEPRSPQLRSLEERIGEIEKKLDQVLNLLKTQPPAAFVPQAGM